MAMSLQEIFDKAATHLLKQGRRSKAEIYREGQAVDRCAYRGDGGAMCAVGAFIPDALYSPELEGKSCLAEKVQKTLVEAGVADILDLDDAALGRRFYLLSSLQNLHDMEPVEQWPSCLRAVAEQYGLNYVQPS